MNDLTFTQGQDNISGLAGDVYACPTEDIATVPALAVATSLVTAAADITCKTGKKFSKIYFTDETAKAETKGIGERDGKGRETMLTGRYPAIGTALEDFISQCQNTPSVLIYRLKKNGKLFLLGVTRLDKTSTVLSLTIPAYFEQGDGTTGEKTADQNGALMGWKYSSAHGPIEYAGAVPLVAAP